MKCDICNQPIFGGYTKHRECMNNQARVGHIYRSMGQKIMVSGVLLENHYAWEYLSKMPAKDFESLWQDFNLLA